jgi:hypothetical protein
MTMLPPHPSGPAPIWGSRSEPAETEELAIVAFVCGLVGLFIGGVILGPIAIVVARSAELRIRYAEGTLKGGGLVKADGSWGGSPSSLASP